MVLCGMMREKNKTKQQALPYVSLNFLHCLDEIGCAMC